MSQKRIYQNNEADNLHAVVATLMRIQGIALSADTIETELVTHKNYPSLESVCNAFETWGVPNMPVRIGAERLASIPLPAIAHLHGGIFVLLEAVDKDSVQFWDTAKGKKTLSLQDFESVWSGALLLVEKPENTKEVLKNAHSKEHKSKIRKTISYIFGAILIGLSIFSLLSVSVHFLGLACAKAVGLFFSVGLLSSSFNAGASSWFSSLCTMGKETDCKAVLQTKAAQIFSWLSWAEMGFFYFAGGLLCLIFASWQASPEAILPFLALLTLLALPYTFFSVYYQWRVAKQWCPLCLGVQAVFWIEGTLFLAAPPILGFKGEELLKFPLTIVGFSFLLPIVGWFLFSEIWKKAREAKNWRLRTLRLQRNPIVFNAIMASQKPFTSPYSGADEHLSEAATIVLGNENAPVEIVIFTNPHCNPCAKIHEDLEELLEIAQQKIKVSLYFLSFPQREKDTEALLEACFSGTDAQARQEILHHWYKDKKIILPASKKTKIPNLDISQVRKAHEKAAQENEIQATPTIFVQGFTLPQGYKLKELRYHLKNL